ncbi:MAG: S-layer homology domain-containing protein [Clostridiales bacterium]|nr:S-layer homology domain-containing protein [Clostridiales bacterium]
MMKKIVSMLAISIMLLSVISFGVGITFKDVENHWAKNEIYAMAEKWIILGKGDGTFAPDEKIIKSHAFLMFSRLMGFYEEENKEIVENATEEYSEILQQNGIKQAKAEIAFLVKTEVISMEDIIELLGNGQEEKNLTREEAAYIFVKLLNDEDKLNTFISEIFKDTDEIDDKYIKHVEYVKNIGLMLGMDENNFGPKENVTRAQVATILYRVDEIIYERKLTEINGEIREISDKEISVYVGEEERIYNITHDTLVFSDTELIQIETLKKGDLVQLFVKDNNDIDRIYLNNVEKNVYGTFAGYEINSETKKVEKIYIIQNDKQYAYLVYDNVIVKNGNKTVNIENIKVNENIELQILNGKVKQIDIGKIYYKEQGIIEEIIIGKQNYITIKNLKGESVKYLLLKDSLYDFDGAEGNIYDLRLEMDVELTVNNDGVEKVEVVTLTNIEILKGKVDKILPKIYVFTMINEEGQTLMMFLDEEETVIKTQNGVAKDITDIKQGDNVSIYGRYEGDVFYPIQVIIHNGEVK